LAHAINGMLGNFGKTVFLLAPVEARPNGRVDTLTTLVKELEEKKVEALVIIGVNPAYTASANVGFTAAVKNVPFTLHLGQHQDETAVLCEWHVNESHYLETWGDIRGHDGTATIQQPLIAPLYDGRSAIEMLAAITSAPFREGLDIVKAYWGNAEEVQK